MECYRKTEGDLMTIDSLLLLRNKIMTPV